MKKGSIRLTACLVICGLALAIFGIKGLVVSLLPAVDLSDPSIDWTTLKANQHVKVDTFYTDGYFGSYSDDDGKESCRRYTLIQMVNIDGEDYYSYFMAINVKPEDYSKYDKAAEELEPWFFYETNILPTNVANVDGYLKKMTKDEKAALLEWIEDFGMNEEEALECLVPYTVMENQKGWANILMAVGGLLMLAGGVVSGIFCFKN